MKTLKALLSSLFLLSSSLLFGQNWLWGAQGVPYGLKPVVSCQVATDTKGNAFITGEFYPAYSFGSDTLVDSTISSNSGIYLVKYNSAGTIQWAQQFVCNIGYHPSIATDVSNNVIIYGGFSSNITFGSFNLTGINTDFFLAKCDNNGNPKWAIAGNQIGGGTSVYSNPNSVVTDSLKNIFITGYFTGTMKFGTATLVSSAGGYTIFIAKYDSNGNFLWVKQGVNLSYYNYNEQSCYIATDKKGNSYITGFYRDSIIFGNDTLTPPLLNNGGGGNVFLLKYDPSGNQVWARQSLIPKANCGGSGTTVTTDNVGNVYLAGSYAGPISFGAYTINGAGVYFVKYNSAGTALWAQGSNYSYTGYALHSDGNDFIYLAGGGGMDSITFGSLTLNGNPNGFFNSFIVKFDTSGNAICGSMLYNGNHQYPVSSAVDETGNYIYLASIFFDKDIYCGPDTLVGSGQQAPFVARWQNCGLESINEIKTDNEKLSVFPNPFTNSTTIQVESGKYTMPSQNAMAGKEAQSYLELYDLTGQKLKSISFTGTTYSLSAEGLAKGMYFIKVLDKDKNVVGTSKIVVQ